MSDITLLRDGKLSPVQFAEKVAGEFKDNPFAKAFAPLLLSALQRELTVLIKSPTIAALIVSSITALMNGGMPALQDVVTGAVTTALGGLGQAQQGQAAVSQ